MPDHEESTPAAPIPRIDPAQWEEHEGFRQTLLRHFPGERCQATRENPPPSGASGDGLAG